MRTFSSADSLWETVDSIMVDLMEQPAAEPHPTDGTDEQHVTILKKNEELEEMMENLDNILDDLQEIPGMSNGKDNTTPPRPINLSAEKNKKRPKNDESFLEKENPFDPITQGFLLQTGDVPLFSSSSSTTTDEVVETEISYEEYVAGDWGGGEEGAADEGTLDDANDQETDPQSWKTTSTIFEAAPGTSLSFISVPALLSALVLLLVAYADVAEERG